MYRWLSGDNIKSLFAESEEFESESSWANLETSETFENRAEEEEDFDQDWVRNIDAEIEEKEKKAKVFKKLEEKSKSESETFDVLDDMNLDKPKK